MKRIIHTEEERIVALMNRIKHRMFPRAFERLGVRGNIKHKGLVGVEIGVYKAEHALSLLEHLDIKTLYLVDPYVVYPEFKEGQQYYGTSQSSLCVAEKIAKKRLKGFEKKVVCIRKCSWDCSNEIPDNLDFVYIDGNHLLKFVRMDIETYFPKVRPGGVIGGHDFYNGFQREHDHVVKAVTEFAVHRNLQLQIELPDWWIVKNQ